VEFLHPKRSAIDVVIVVVVIVRAIHGDGDAAPPLHRR
jgi:hypothetical protein